MRFSIIALFVAAAVASPYAEAQDKPDLSALLAGLKAKGGASGGSAGGKPDLAALLAGLKSTFPMSVKQTTAILTRT